MLLPTSTFLYFRRVAFADTDAMGVLHHAQYLIYFEEARVAWLRDLVLSEHHFPKANMVLGVLETHCRHFLPARFEDLVTVAVQARREGLKSPSICHVPGPHRE
ncbi:MAG: thioesterase family protein [Bdellovibrionales bacterium]|nr:thioesterase family protein [Bdellovibrionales bacterium]